MSAWASSDTVPSGPASTGTRVSPQSRGTFQAQARGRPGPLNLDREPLASFSTGTRVTLPRSASGWASMTAKMRSAPAMADSRDVICMEIWFTGWVTCRLYCK